MLETQPLDDVVQLRQLGADGGDLLRVGVGLHPDGDLRAPLECAGGVRRALAQQQGSANQPLTTFQPAEPGNIPGAPCFVEVARPGWNDSQPGLSRAPAGGHHSEGICL